MLGFHGISEEALSALANAILSVNDSLHSHTSESPTLTQQQTLIVSDSLHSHSAESSVLTQAHILIVQDTVHSQSSDSITIQGPPLVVLNTPDDEAIVGDTTPTLEFTGTDPNGNDIVYQIQISVEDTFSSPLIDDISDTDPGFENTETPADTSPFNSGEKIKYTVGSV